MDFSIKDLKKKAKADIKGQIGKCFVVSLIVMLLALVIEVPFMFAEPEFATIMPSINVDMGVMSIIATVLAFLVYIPVTVGMSKFYLKLAKKEDAKVSDIFYYSNKRQMYGSYIIYSLLIGAIVAIYMILIWFALESGYITGFASAAMTLIAAIVYVYFIIEIGFGFSQIFYVICDETTIGACDPLKVSFDWMKGEKWNLFKLSLSFIGWAFLILVTCGIASIYAVPYMNAAFAEFYLYLKEKNTLDESKVEIREF